MVATWRLHPQEPAAAAHLAQAAGVHPAIAQMLINRGIRSAEAARSFLSPGLSELQDPLALPEIDLALERLRRAVRDGEPILIFGDSDVDGITASLILFEALTELGATVVARQSNRLADGYGFPMSVAHQLADSGVKLVIMVDCGTNQPEIVQALSAQGIDTLIIDHHMPMHGRIPAYALVNPHAKADAPGRELCSAGLAFKVAQALSERSDSLQAYLDLAALGTLADCSPLRGDSRQIVAAGLPRIQASDRDGLVRLCASSGIGAVRSDTVVKYLVPRLNAAGRMGDCSPVWNLLRRNQPGAEGLLGETDRIYQRAKEIYRQVVGQAMEQVQRIHFRDLYIVVVHSEGWPKGLMGPLASQLAQAHRRPAIAIAAADGHGTGSGRSVPGFNLLEGLQQCGDLLVRYGGHAQACGLTVALDRFEAFCERLNRHVQDSMGPLGLQSGATFDVELPLAAFEPQWVGELARFAPFGMGNPQPTAVVRSVAIERVSPRKGWITEGKTRHALKGMLPSSEDGTHYDVAVTPTIQAGTLTLSLRDVKLAEGL